MSPEDRATFAELVGESFLPPDADAVTAAEMAEWLGLTPNRVHALGRDGVLPRTADKLYPLRASVRAYADHARQLAKGKATDAALAAEKLRLATANARKVELQNLRAEGQLVPATDVEREWADVLRTLRAAFLSLPSRAAAKLGHLTPHDLAALDAEVRDVLMELAEDG